MYNNKPEDYPSPLVAWTTVGILSITYMFSFLDRQILVLLIDPIKNDLQISDTQVSLLTGFAFAIIYTVMGIPMGRAADLWVRKYVIIIGVTVWSLLTMSCGLARNFWQLFVARMGVGVGEAALTPTAYAMVADLFPPNKLARGMSVFALGGAAGGAASLLVGGFVVGFVQRAGSIHLPVFGDIKSWQLVLIAVGLISLLMIIPLGLIREPQRHLHTGHDLGHQYRFKEVLTFMWAQRAFYGPYIVAICFINIFTYGGAAWLPTFFIRVKGWDAASTGITIGTLSFVMTMIGGISAGWLSDHLFGKGFKGAPIYAIFIVLLICLPLIPAIVYLPGTKAQLTVLGIYTLLFATISILFPAVIQMATPGQIRSQVSAIILFAINLVGIGFGPTAIALVTDYTFADPMAVGHSIAIVGVLVFAIAAFILFFAVKPFKARVNALQGSSISSTVEA